jgi:hypothetical protein
MAKPWMPARSGFSVCIGTLSALLGNRTSPAYSYRQTACFPPENRFGSRKPPIGLGLESGIQTHPFAEILP